MPIASILILAVATFITAFLSGIFGMAGGLILMGVLLSIFPVSHAMVAHGVLQSVANGWRAWLLRRSIILPIFWWYLIGASLAIALLLMIAWRPSRTIVFVLLGLVPFLVWLPKSFFHLDAVRPSHAILAGFLVTALNTFAGVAGPALDIFFVRTKLTRHQIVATKSVTQLVAHIVKVIFWSGIAVTGMMQQNAELLYLLLALIPVSMLGTWGGGKVLNRLNDRSFLQWIKVLVSIIGLVYLIRAIIILIGD
ncbi:MAG: sulfite exporter TauE/SafE family protein [Robiginitomaculum sp.]|nr:sulfite exporter TauE/SafE family protein [Robiginitomaculum sp.]